MSRDAETFRRFASIVGGIEDDLDADVVEVRVEYATDDDGQLFSAMSELMGGATRRPVFKFVVDPDEEDKDQAFEVLGDVVELIEDDLDASVDEVRSAMQERGGGLFSPATERLAFGLIVDADAGVEGNEALEEKLDDVDAESIAEEVVRDAGESTSIEFDSTDEEVDSE